MARTGAHQSVVVMGFCAGVRDWHVPPAVVLDAAPPPRRCGLHARPGGQPRERRAPPLHEPSDARCLIAGGQASGFVHRCPVARRVQRRERLFRFPDWLWVAAPRVSPIVSGRQTSPSRTPDRARRRGLPHNPNRDAQPPAASLIPPLHGISKAGTLGWLKCGRPSYFPSSIETISASVQVMSTLSPTFTFPSVLVSSTRVL